EHQLREPGAAFTSTQAARDWLRLQLSTLEREEFIVLWLDNQHRLIAHETLFRGTISHTEVHPREVVKSGLKHNAAAALVAHCHPSGLAEPSNADRQVTTRIQQALGLVDIRLLDHLVVGGMDIVSFAERGWL
ncbi:DNA repair protein RadC, partial [Salmonella enterica]|nr:DNA repair protein RadC [Salmonella enterica]EJC0346301.1 DNA repair protein RadC [Salmonella enterica]EJC0669560.1 DNA repair protein RadC [Salmonella enterica]